VDEKGVIYRIGNDGNVIRSVDVARDLGISKASVSRILRRLEELGFLSLTKYKNIELTEQSLLEGCNLDEKIGQEYPFFYEYLEHPEEDALESAY
jgi:Mn-dependent DtxR family transcriptional regulator